LTRGGSEVALSHREFELLAYLCAHKNQTVTRDMLGRDVWKEPSHALTNAIDAYISLSGASGEARPAAAHHTVSGVGYSLREGHAVSIRCG